MQVPFITRQDQDESHALEDKSPEDPSQKSGRGRGRGRGRGTQGRRGRPRGSGAKAKAKAKAKSEKADKQSAKSKAKKNQKKEAASAEPAQAAQQGKTLKRKRSPKSMDNLEEGELCTPFRRQASTQAPVPPKVGVETPPKTSSSRPAAKVKAKAKAQQKKPDDRPEVKNTWAYSYVVPYWSRCAVGLKVKDGQSTTGMKQDWKQA